MPVADSSDAHSLLSTARDLIHIDDPETAGLWPRATALLGRQAIEAAMEALWKLSAPGLESASLKCQLLCLTHFLGDRDLAGRVHVTWEGLSRSCHIRTYELAPTADELQGWLETTWELAEAVASIGARKSTGSPAKLHPFTP
jgi:hypothetical protein